MKQFAKELNDFVDARRADVLRLQVDALKRRANALERRDVELDRFVDALNQRANVLERRLDVLGRHVDTFEACSNMKKEYGKTFAVYKKEHVKFATYTSLAVTFNKSLFC
nr:hypothetical protein [Tanacetum cinerariifolium]GEX93051.1 hypothetical protein [Tanacetum cinerariifolium]